jgi:desampylase
VSDVATAVTISRALLDRLMAEAEGSPDREVCGLLLGSAGRIDEVWPVPNAAPDPSSAFLLDPAVHLAASRHAREAGKRIVGHYHSHPSGRAEPSSVDQARAWEEGALWLILGSGDARLWVSRGGDLVELKLRTA